MPRNKRKHPHSRYERIMLACIDSLPFKFNSPGEPNIPGDEPEPSSKEKWTVTAKIGEHERTYRFAKKTSAYSFYNEMEANKRKAPAYESNRMSFSTNAHPTPTQSKRKSHRTPYRGEK